MITVKLLSWEYEAIFPSECMLPVAVYYTVTGSHVFKPGVHPHGTLPKGFREAQSSHTTSTELYQIDVF